jgi:hypothetical protein
MLNKKQWDLLKADPITSAVDAANLLLAPHGVKIKELMSNSWGSNSNLYRIEGKLYTKETMDAVEALEKKYYRVEWTDTFDYDDYISYETEVSLEERIRAGRNNMQRFNGKNEITKEEYLSHKRF